MAKGKTYYLKLSPIVRTLELSDGAGKQIDRTVRDLELQALQLLAQVGANTAPNRRMYFSACELLDQVKAHGTEQRITGLNSDDFKLLDQAFNHIAKGTASGRPGVWTHLRGLWEQLDREVWSSQGDDVDTEEDSNV